MLFLSRDVLRSHILDISIIPPLVITPIGVEQGYPQNREKSLLFIISCSFTHTTVSWLVVHIIAKVKETYPNIKWKLRKNLIHNPATREDKKKYKDSLDFDLSLRHPWKGDKQRAIHHWWKRMFDRISKRHQTCDFLIRCIRDHLRAFHMPKSDKTPLFNKKVAGSVL